MPKDKIHEKKAARSRVVGAGHSKAKRSSMIFYYLMITIPILFFVILEVGLNIFNYGRNYDIFIPSKRFGNDLLELNPNISYKYFDNVNVFNSDTKIFYKIKKENSFRVFVLGESSAQGFPYNIAASFPSYIKRRLDLLYPDTEIEVVNLGASAISSFTLLDLVPEVLKQNPDLILIYAGHNEYYGALGAASTMSLGRNRAFVNFMIYLRSFKTVELLRNLLSSSRSKANANDQIPLMQKMIGESAIPFGSDIYQSGLKNFEGNLKDILDKIKDANVPVVLSTFTSNLRDQKPFVSNDKDNNLTASDYFNHAQSLLQKGEGEQAKSLFV
jgi:lysophospholipase L1-like esterase